MTFGANAYAFDGGDDFDINDIEEVPIEGYNNDNIQENYTPEGPMPMYSRAPDPMEYTNDTVRHSLDFFDIFSKYISLAFLITFIALILIQPRIKYLVFGRLLGYDKKILIQIMQAISIGVISSFSAYHTLN